MTRETTERFVFPEWLRWVLGSVTFLAAAILILSIVLGIRAGQSQLELQSRQQIGISLQRALDYRSEGNLEAALEEYRRVLILDPNNTAAADGIEILLALASGQVSAEAVADQNGASNPAVAPTSAAANGVTSTTNPQFDNAQIAFESGRWQDAIALLEEMRQTGDSSEQVTALLYNAYLSMGIEQERQDKFEPALSTLDKALAVRPGAPEAQNARNTIAAYLDVLTLSGADWEKAVATLEKLYALDAGYRDVRERLQRAHMQYGDALVADQDWCAAVSQYNAAIAIQVTPGSISKRDKYQALCDGSDTVAPELGNGSTLDSAAGAADATNAGTANDAQVESNPAASTPTPQSTEPEAEEPIVSAPVVSGSPSGGRILYSARELGSGRSLVFAQPVGSGAAPGVLVEDASQPAMRNDGARLAYHNLRDDSIGLGSIDPSSGLRLRFTQFAEDSLPSWSHDGSRVVFASNREGDRLWRIYTVWAEENGATQNLSFGESPDWHPTADLIAFRGCDERGNGCGIWTMTGNGGNRQPLTNIPADTRPDWSPDGSFVAFTSDARHGNPEIYRVNVNDGSVVRLTDSGASDLDPTVSPDGAWVAFLSNRDGAWKIWAAPVVGGEAQIVTAIVGDVGNWLEQNIQWIP